MSNSIKSVEAVEGDEKEEKVKAGALDTHSRAQLPLGCSKTEPNEPHLIGETVLDSWQERADCLAMSATQLICSTSTPWPLEIAASQLHFTVSLVDTTLLGMPFAKRLGSTIVAAI